MAGQVRKPSLLERLTPPAPVPRPEAVVWAGWLILALYLCVLVLLYETHFFTGMTWPSNTRTVPDLMGHAVVTTPLLIFLGVWKARSIMLLRSMGTRFAGGRRHGFRLMVLWFLFPLYRLLLAKPVLMGNDWDISSLAVVSEIVSVGSVFVISAAALLLEAVANDILSRDGVVQAFAAAEASRQLNRSEPPGADAQGSTR